MREKSLIVLFILVIFLLFGTGWRWSRGPNHKKLLNEYQNRKLVKDGRGNFYCTPASYGGNVIPIESSKDGKNWKKVGEVHSEITYSAWGSSLFVDREDRIYLVWSSSCRRSGLPQRVIYLSKSIDYGKSWSLPTPIFGSHPDVKGGFYPKVFVDSEKTVYVSWRGVKSRDLYLAISQDGGRTWASVERLRVGKDICFTEGDDGKVYLGYVGGKVNTIFYFSYTEDRGKTWHTKTIGEMPLPMEKPYLKVYKGIIYLIYKGWVPTISGLMPGGASKYNVYLKVSKDGGERWEGSIKLDQK